MEVSNILQKMFETIGVKNKNQLAKYLNIENSFIAGWEKRGKIPEKYIYKISQDSNLPYEYFLNNTNKNEYNTNKCNQSTTFYSIPKLNISASAGGGNELIGLEEYETGEMLELSKAFFKTTPKNLKAIKVDGYSMVPMLLPDSWVVFEETHEYQGDGLYILNFDNQLMVKLLQLNPISKILDIISVNKDYKSYSIDLKDSQIELIIQGKVLRSII
ncbi:transcriptional regulator, putative [Campylobacter jejuni subsp. jejuni 414]|nr:transcriptional regulator, putative [Campylobacter jejuni subsp. jejuni 414]HDZ5095036.1 LexA family transcriptional regulator [Campylobacter jejuni]HDZ5110600.1 LexA family transcriptional regulator [Campylobacter jejuni]HDZ5125279.1 LexA family transcriptional regulator [Campylobacter jejuni]HDZ5134791.1 LexA family transcriptional regulator [Campylobacter jejuni]